MTELAPHLNPTADYSDSDSSLNLFQTLAPLKNNSASDRRLPALPFVRSEEMANCTEQSRILIIDDDPANIRVLNEMLATQYEVFGTTKGSKALSMAEQVRPDLIMLDVIMPEMAGEEVCRRLKDNESTRDIPVIFLTSCTDPERVLIGFNLGAVDYVTKPFWPPELLARVATHIQLRQARQEVARKNAELQEQQGLFLHMIPHDLRTTLAIIRGYAERIIRTNGNKHEQCASCSEQIREILKGCDRQKALITDLIDVARLRAQQYPLAKIPITVGYLVTAVMQHAGSILDPLRFKVAVSDDLPEVRVDERCMDRVLLNLLTNAQKYSPPESMIVIRAWQERNSVIVAVCDKGAEIAPQDLSKIFIPYYRAYQEGTTEGEGLGLYIAKLLVEAHNGHIWVAREDGRENRFCFSLPVA
jgi:two-component system, sensor histidine kinase and response regulator